MSTSLSIAVFVQSLQGSGVSSVLVRMLTWSISWALVATLISDAKHTLSPQH